MIWGLIALVLVLVVETANYLIVEPRIVIDDNWTKNITKKCPDADMAQAYYNKSEI